MSSLVIWDEMLAYARSGDYDKAAEAELKYFEEKIKESPSTCRERPLIPESKSGRQRHYNIYLQMMDMDKKR